MRASLSQKEEKEKEEKGEKNLVFTSYAIAMMIDETDIQTDSPPAKWAQLLILSRFLIYFFPKKEKIFWPHNNNIIIIKEEERIL